MSQKLTNLVFFALICALWQPATSSGNFEGCSYIEKGRCQSCYLRKMDPSTGGCGPVVPESDRCNFYGYNKQKTESKCFGCKKGFTYDITKPEGQNCIPSTLSQSCISGFVINNRQACAECLRGYVIDGGHNDCTPASQIQFSDPKCLWGGVAGLRFVTCKRCNFGYAWSTQNFKCVPFTKGCIVFDGNTRKCLVCDVYDGYYADPHSKGGYCSH